MARSKFSEADIERLKARGFVITHDHEQANLYDDEMNHLGLLYFSGTNLYYNPAIPPGETRHLEPERRVDNVEDLIKSLPPV